MSDELVTPEPEPPAKNRRKRLIIWIAVALVALVAAFYGAIFVYTELINDPEERLTAAELSERLQTTTTAAAPSSTVAAADATTAPTTTAAAAGTTGAPATSPPADDDATVHGTWTATADSELGYRVKENLFGVDTEAVGRTNQVTGSLTLEGTQVTAADFTVDVASITSDESRRDSAFRGRVMTTDQFPTATFVLTEPIELGSIPAPGEQIVTPATGDLTLRGTTNPVTFDVTAQLEGNRIGVFGNIPVLFSDYGIANPSSSGVTTEDNGLLEFILVFGR